MRALVVDDEINLANTIKRGLEVEGFNVDVCHDGEEGLWAATEQPYNIVILDLMLPKVNGSTSLTYFAREMFPVPHVIMPANRARSLHGKWTIDDCETRNHPEVRSRVCGGSETG